MAGKESIHKKLSRVRPPRVHITYEVFTNGAIEKREIPFVVGVLADLSGHTKQTKQLKDRKFTQIDRDNVDDVMKKVAPTLGMKVKNTLKDDGSELGVALKFEKMADFKPDNVVKQVPVLNDLLELRAKLANLRSTMYGDDELEKLLQDVVKKTEELQASGGAQPGSEEKK